jgi:hypothetical protein
VAVLSHLCHRLIQLQTRERCRVAWDHVQVNSPHGPTPFSRPHSGCESTHWLYFVPCQIQRREFLARRVAGIFVRFYTLRRSIWLFNALQRNRADLSTGCWPWYRSYQPRRRSPWGGKRRPGALRGCLFASMSYPTRAKERP